MKYGYFNDPQKEYVITRPDTPCSWTNYLGDTRYGAITTNNAGGYSFYRSAANGRFTRLMFNSIPMDQPGRYVYLRDRADGDFWSASWQPVGKPLDDYSSECRHGTGYTEIESTYRSIRTLSRYFVPLDQKFEYWQIRIRNEDDQPRELSFFTYLEFANQWSIHQDLLNLQYSQYIVEGQLENNFIRIAIHDRLGADNENPDGNDGGQRSWITLLGAPIDAYDANREAFIGTYGDYSKPEAVAKGTCTNSFAYGGNACGSFQVNISLKPGEEKTLIVLAGIGDSRQEGAEVLKEFGDLERCDQEFSKLKDFWHKRLNALNVQTPDKDFDSMINVWNPYNCLMTYAWSRHASLVYTGERDGLGFRDTVQDLMAVFSMIPDEARERLELMLTGQFSNGGALPVVKPWAHYPGKTEVIPAEEFRSDDCLWFFNTIPAYVAETGDTAFYDKILPYADKDEETVLNHLKRALEFNLSRSGSHGLPCGLKADWNDCLKLGYKGESLFVAFQVSLGLQVYADICQEKKLDDEVLWAIETRKDLDKQIQAHCWDQDRWIWAIAEDGTVYGTKDSPEGAVYLNTQVWSVISGVASDEQTKASLDTVRSELFTEYGAMLCAPPIKTMDINVMGAKVFNPGTKENAGIFNHPQGWLVIAEAMAGNGNRAYKCFRAFMPSAMNDHAEIRGIEPYVYGQSTQGKPSPNFGKSHLPWLSGTAAWAYQSATQYILGIRPEAKGLVIDPCIPASWPGFKATRMIRGMRVEIEVTNPNGLESGANALVLDGDKIEGNLIPYSRLKDDSKIQLVLGSQ